MKIKGWLIGLIALVGGSALLLDRLLNRDAADNYQSTNWNSKEKNFGAFPPEISEEQFEKVDFLT